MAAVWAGLFVALLVLVLCLHVFGLPANWILLALVAVWRWAHPQMDAGVWFFVLLAVLAATGEIVEFVSQAWSVKRFGGSSRANWWSILGAIVGAVVGAPFFFGLGALPGALIGAWLAAVTAELSLGRCREEALRSGWGALFGKVLGLSVKLGLGATMLVLAARQLWPA